MKSSILPLTALALAGALYAQAPEVGTTVSYKFNETPMNAHGVRSFDDLRGKPTVIEFWGVN
jgi:hypothetical protein